VRRSDVQAWTAGLGLAPTTVQQALRLLSSIFRAAVHDRLVRGNPCDGVRLARREGSLLTAPTIGEVQALAGGIVAPLRAAVLVAAMTGVRQGELFGLTEDRVRWLDRTVVIDRQLLTDRGGVRLGPCKTTRSVRSIPATDGVLELLAEQVRVYGLGPDGLVFHEGGRAWRRHAAAKEMRAAGGSGWHGLRHHCASVLIAQGLSVTAVAAVLGDSPAVTLSTYSHWWPSEDEAIRAAVVRAWEPVARPLRGLADGDT
jgi:integrase